MSEHKVTCKEVITHVCENLGEDLDSPKCIEIKEHLESCENCKKYFTTLDTTIEFYKKYNVSITEDVHNRLIKHLGLEE